MFQSLGAVLPTSVGKKSRKNRHKKVAETGNLLKDWDVFVAGLTVLLSAPIGLEEARNWLAGREQVSWKRCRKEKCGGIAQITAYKWTLL
jgi:hypothetical protein